MRPATINPARGALFGHLVVIDTDLRFPRTPRQIALGKVGERAVEVVCTRTYLHKGEPRPCGNRYLIKASHLPRIRHCTRCRGRDNASRRTAA